MRGKKAGEKIVSKIDNAVKKHNIGGKTKVHGAL